MRVLTKSRFNLGLECPNKLYFTRKKEYANLKNEDTFLMAMAQGGFQVEELARLHYPGGVLIEENDGDYSNLWNITRGLLEKSNVTIYEAAFLWQSLFARTDILVKTEDTIDIIEVKSKSYYPNDEHIFIGSTGKMITKWKPYLYDIAFQHYVVSKCYPGYKIRSFIMMADKTKKATIDGMNQLFRITQTSNHRTGIECRVTSLSETGSSVLGLKNVSDIIRDIQLNKYEYHKSLTFEGAIDMFREAYESDTYLNWPTSYSVCKNCEFKTEEIDSFPKSGFEYCFKKQYQWPNEYFSKPSTMKVWNFGKGDKLFKDGIHFMDQLTEESIGLKDDADKLSASARQWIQICKENSNDSSVYIDKVGLSNEVRMWNFPLHFIDFETSAVALPFHKGRRPYEQIAFQFSHHILQEDGKIDHRSEFINSEPGVYPNFDFIRELKRSLENDEGTIFRFAAHENTIVNAIHGQLLDSDEKDKLELIAFIEDISTSVNYKLPAWQGERNMVDLCQVIKWYYYNPFTKGSNSMKKILPSILQTSSFLQKKYGQPLRALNISSKNFDPSFVWLQRSDGHIINPYMLLPPLYEGWSAEDLEDSIAEMDDIADGGAALVAYAKLQFTDMTTKEREELNRGLLKYCELDTLAMVMVFEHLAELLGTE